MENIIFDKNGNPSLIIKDNYLIIFKNSKYAGCIQEDKVYDFNGRQRAWLEGGFLIDLNGKIVGFTEQISDSDKNRFKLPATKNLKTKAPPKTDPPLEPALFLTQNIKDKIKPSRNTKWSNMNPSTLMTA